MNVRGLASSCVSRSWTSKPLLTGGREAWKRETARRRVRADLVAGLRVHARDLEGLGAGQGLTVTTFVELRVDHRFSGYTTRVAIAVARWMGLRSVVCRICVRQLKPSAMTSAFSLSRMAGSRSCSAHAMDTS